MRGGRDGFIVAAVLAVLALLTGLLGSLSLAVRGEVDAVLTASEQVRLEGLTQAGAALVAYELYELKRPAFRVNGREIRLDDGVVRVTVEDEAGKIDLNGSAPVLLAGLYRAAGLADIEPEVFAARVVAWRERFPPSGGNRERREPGFRSVGELRWLPGLSASDAAVLSEFVTVLNPQGTIAPATAPVAVLSALPGLMPQTIDRVLRLREAPTDRLAEDLANLLRDQQAYLAGKGGRCFRVVLEATTTAQSRRRIRLTTVKAAQDQALYYTTSYEPVF
jgi:general secretion pathway protein K